MTLLLFFMCNVSLFYGFVLVEAVDISLSCLLPFAYENMIPDPYDSR